MNPSNDPRRIFEQYTAAWRAPTREAMRAALAQSVSPRIRYRDPQTKRNGHDELVEAIVELQGKVPGVHFEVTYFLAYEDRAIARWNMLGANDEVLGDGTDSCELGADGKLTAITGFFPT